MKRLLVLVVALGCALAFSSAAFADALTCAHGGGPCGQAGGGEGAGGAGTLPFTGFNLGWIAAVGVLLLVTGVALLQRPSRRGQ